MAEAALVDDEVGRFPLSAGATLTLQAAERRASWGGHPRVSASHLLATILERPDPRIREYITGWGASAHTLRDAIVAALYKAPAFDGEDVTTILETAEERARALGRDRVDDFTLFLASLDRADALSKPILTSAGLIAPERPVQASPPPAAPRFIAPMTPAPVAVPAARPLLDDRTKRNVRALLDAIEVSPLFLAMVAGLAVIGGALALADPFTYNRALIVGFVVMSYLISLCLHEFGHAAAAFLTGQRSVKDQGYLTLDIRRYSNPFLTFVLPLVSLFLGRIPLPGGCVWIRDSYFRTVREDRLISAAGPLANLVCLILLSIPLRMGMDQWSPLGVAIAASALIQVAALLFNLLPVPPLDGWQIYTAGASASFRQSAAALSWMPLIALFVLFRAVPELSWAFWDTVDVFAGVLGIQAGPSNYGMWMLYL